MNETGEVTESYGQSQGSVTSLIMTSDPLITPRAGGPPPPSPPTPHPRSVSPCRTSLSSHFVCWSTVPDSLPPLIPAASLPLAFNSGHFWSFIFRNLSGHRQSLSFPQAASWLRKFSADMFLSFEF